MSETRKTRHFLRIATMLSEALPYMRKFSGKTFVIKFGGAAMRDPELAQLFARDVVLLKQVGINPVVVHGGGPQIGRMLERLALPSRFVDGLRVTDAETVEVVEMVLSGQINKHLVTAINRAGGTAIGVSGKDGNLIVARRLSTGGDANTVACEARDLGFVGTPDTVNARMLDQLAQAGMIPVIAPIGVGRDGATYNINADTAAGAIASALNAAKLMMLTDVAGVLGTDGGLIATLTGSKARTYLDDKTISGGMIPKVETCLAAVANHVEAAHILDGRTPHVLLLEVFTEHGVGTMITAED